MMKDYTMLNAVNKRGEHRMETSYVFDEHGQDITTNVESEKHNDADADADREADAAAKSSLDKRDRDVLIFYLREIRTSPLLSQQEEVQLGRERAEQEQKKHALTEQGMLIVGQIINKRLLSSQIRIKEYGKAYQTVALCIEFYSMHKKNRQLDCLMKRNAARSHNRRKLRSSKAALISEMQKIVAQVDFLKLGDSIILRALNTLSTAERKKKLRAKKEFRSIMTELRNVAERDQAAKEKLVKSNLRLVITMARKYINWGMPLADLVQEGNIGLMRAVDKYDYRLGLRLSTYACWWIRQSIMRSIDEQTRTIHIPVYVHERIKNINKITRQLLQNTGGELTVTKVAETTGLSVDHVDKMLRVAQDAISLETPTGKEDQPLRYFIAHTPGSSPLDELHQLQRQQLADKALAILSPREAAIIRLRYGMGVDAEHTLAEIGDKIGVSRERIRQIEAAALRKLQRSPKIRALQLV